MTTCQLCEREIGDQAYACDLCAAPVARALRRLARLVPELDVTIARQGRQGDGGRGGDNDSLPVNLAAVEQAWAVANTLTVWIREVAAARGVRSLWFARLAGPTCRTNAGVPGCKHRSCRAVSASGQPVDELAAGVRWLAGQVEWIRHQPDAAQALDELGDAAALAERIVDRRSPKWYAGPCRQPVAVDEDGRKTAVDAGEPCNTELYAYPGARVVRCGTCATEYDARARKDWLLDAARDTLVHAELLARAITALGVHTHAGREVTPAMVRGMARHGRIAERGADHARRPLYRVGDVLELIEERRAAAARRSPRQRVEGSAA